MGDYMDDMKYEDCTPSDEYMKAWREGRDKGYREGHKEGYHSGYAQAKRDGIKLEEKRYEHSQEANE